MSFTTFAEKYGMELGLRMGLVKGIALGVKVKFGQDGLSLMPAIEKIEDVKVIETLFNALDAGAGLDEIRNLIPVSGNSASMEIPPQPTFHTLLAKLADDSTQTRDQKTFIKWVMARDPLLGLVQVGLEERFGTSDSRLMTAARCVQDLDVLEVMFLALRRGASHADLRAILAQDRKAATRL